MPKVSEIVFSSDYKCDNITVDMNFHHSDCIDHTRRPYCVAKLILTCINLVWLKYVRLVVKKCSTVVRNLKGALKFASKWSLGKDSLRYSTNCKYLLWVEDLKSFQWSETDLVVQISSKPYFGNWLRFLKNQPVLEEMYSIIHINLKCFFVMY